MNHHSEDEGWHWSQDFKIYLLIAESVFSRNDPPFMKLGHWSK